MTNEHLITLLCKRANDLYPPCDEFSCTSVSIFSDTNNNFVQAWFSYWANDKRDPTPYDYDNFIAEERDLHTALITLESWLFSREAEKEFKLEEQKLEKLNQQVLSEHRELILAGIGFGD